MKKKTVELNWMLEVTFGQINISRNSNLNQEKGSFLEFLNICSGAKSYEKWGCFTSFWKHVFFFTTHLIFFSRPAWTDIDINIALNFCGKKDDSPLWVRRRLNIFMNYSLKILFATNCKACDLANCLWLLIKNSFRASKLKLDANVPTIIVNYGKLKSPKITGW